MVKKEPWELFEEKVAELYEKSGYEVQHQAKIKGRSGGEYKIDVYAVKEDIPLHEYKIAIECKYWNRRITRKVVAEAGGTKEDLCVHEYAIYSREGFTKGAKQYAKEYGIILRDAKEVGIYELADDQLGMSSENINNIFRAAKRVGERMFFKKTSHEIKPVCREFEIEYLSRLLKKEMQKKGVGFPIIIYGNEGRIGKTHTTFYVLKQLEKTKRIKIIGSFFGGRTPISMLWSIAYKLAKNSEYGYTGYNQKHLLRKLKEDIASEESHIVFFINYRHRHFGHKTEQVFREALNMLINVSKELETEEMGPGVTVIIECNEQPPQIDGEQVYFPNYTLRQREEITKWYIETCTRTDRHSGLYFQKYVASREYSVPIILSLLRDAAYSAAKKFKGKINADDFFEIISKHESESSDLYFKNFELKHMTEYELLVLYLMAISKNKQVTPRDVYESLEIMGDSELVKKLSSDFQVNIIIDRLCEKGHISKLGQSSYELNISKDLVIGTWRDRFSEFEGIKVDKVLM